MIQVIAYVGPDLDSSIIRNNVFVTTRIKLYTFNPIIFRMKQRYDSTKPY